MGPNSGKCDALSLKSNVKTDKFENQQIIVIVSKFFPVKFHIQPMLLNCSMAT